jgi:hypothetical protein
MSSAVGMAADQVAAMSLWLPVSTWVLTDVLDPLDGGGALEW